MQQILSPLLISVLLASVLSGCQKEREATFAGQPQAEHQRAKTSHEMLEQNVVLLNLEDSERKNIRGATKLGEAGAAAAFALPALEKAAKSHPIASVREAAKSAIDQIKTAQASGESAE